MHLPLKPVTLAALVLAVSLAGAPPVGAQAVPGAPPASPTDIITTGTAYRVYRIPGEATVEIYVVGLPNAGVYVIGSQTSLTELITITGSSPTSSESEVASRIASVSVLREEGGRRLPVYTAPMEQALAEPGAHPNLQNGDLVSFEVEVTVRTTFLDYVEYASRFASIALLFLRLADYAR